MAVDVIDTNCDDNDEHYYHCNNDFGHILVVINMTCPNPPPPHSGLPDSGAEVAQSVKDKLLETFGDSYNRITQVNAASLGRKFQTLSGLKAVLLRAMGEGQRARERAREGVEEMR